MWNPFSWFFRSASKTQVARPSAPNAYQLMVVGSTQAGIYVNSTTALNCSAWWSGIRLLSDALGMMPAQQFTTNKRGESTQVDASPVARLLRRPSPAMTRFTFFQTLMLHVLSKGDFFGEILLGKGSGRAGAIMPMDPDDIMVGWNADGTEKVYQSRSNTSKVWTQDQVIHVPGLGFDGLRGYNVLEFAKQSIALDIAAEQYGAGWFGSGGRPNAVMTTPGKLSPEAADRVRQEWRKNHPPGSHELAIMQDGAALNFHDNDPTKAQAIETRKHQLTVVARYLRVPPHMLYETGNQRMSNLEQLGQEFLTFSLAPWLTLIEEEFECKLLTEEEQITNCIEFDETELLRANSLARMQRHVLAVNAGIETIADARRDEGLGFMDGTDILRVPLNYGKLNPDGTVTNLGAGNPNGNGISNQNEVQHVTAA